VTLRLLLIWFLWALVLWIVVAMLVAWVTT